MVLTVDYFPIFIGLYLFCINIRIYTAMVLAVDLWTIFIVPGVSIYFGVV